MLSKLIEQLFRGHGASEAEVKQVASLLNLLEEDATTVLPASAGGSVLVAGATQLPPAGLSALPETVGTNLFEGLTHDEQLPGDRHATTATLPVQDGTATRLPDPSHPSGLSGLSGLESRLLGLGGRYQVEDVLGRGGMGLVYRVLDRRLGRRLAMKVASEKVMGSPSALARFLEEAETTAQLQHPSIIPVHDLGRLPDGRCYITMKEVRGRTLGDVIAEVHAARTPSGWSVGASGWTFRRLVDAFARVCEAVVYAHEVGVIHRDLKPSNIMLGKHGEVLVIDWGIAKVTTKPDLAQQLSEDEPGGLERVQTDRSQDHAQATRMGMVAGTPGFMAPEQAMGGFGQVDARSDVYALGAILYQLLSGRSPYSGSSQAVLQQVLAGPPVLAVDQLETGPDPLLPAELVGACQRAMARDPQARYPTASALAGVVVDWLGGARRRAQAQAVVAAAHGRQPEVGRLQSEARSLRAAAAERLAGVASWEPEDKKLPGWELEDRAAELERASVLVDLEVEQGLYGALRIDGGLVDAHQALALRHQAAHREAEEARLDEARARAEVLLRRHVSALPKDSRVRVSASAYLKGDGALTLVTDPPGAEVMLYRYEPHNRRLVPRFVRSLGRSPIEKTALPMGSYLCLMRHPERVETRYPVFIGRQEHWDGVAPGEREPHPIQLPERGTLGEDDCYVPAGWFWSGGDPGASNALPQRRLWSHAFVMCRFPVTNRQYVEFLDSLVSAGREADALRFVPRERAGHADQLGAMIYGRRSDGRFELVPDEEGDLWEQDWPVCMVDWECSVAFAAWQAERTGQGWRLPGELEWEKAGRGVDGRFRPWGDGFDPSWCCMASSHQGSRLPSVVDSHPVDESVYGVRGMAGNMIDWCAEHHGKMGPDVLPGGRLRRPDSIDEQMGESVTRFHRGGSWNANPRDTRLAYRNGNSPGYRANYLGIRVSRTTP